MVGKNWFAGALLVATTLAPSTVRAQTKEDLMLPVPASDAAIGGRFGRALPGVSASSPVAFGANFRDVFAFVGYQAKTRFADSDDGTASVGFGLGNSSDAIGLEVVFTTLSTVRSGLFDRTAAGFKVHRLLPGMVSIAAGIEGIKLRGDQWEMKQSVYGVISKVAALRNGGDPATPFSQITLNAGLGNGRFCAEDIKQANGLADCGVNVFGSIGLRANEYIGLIGDWGQDIDFGVSFVPFRKFPLVITPALADLTGSAGDKIRFIVGAGFGLRF